jgi:pteridine reductase
MELRGRTALVTGGARRIGRAIALGLGARGARVAVHHHRSAAEAAAVVDALRAAGTIADAFAADLTDARAVRALGDTVAGALGPVDVLVNNASVFYRTPLAALDERAWDDNFAVNAKAPYLLSLHLGRAMRARGAGKIVNVGDAGGGRAWAEYVPYAASKAALVALTQGFAKALAPAVQVNCVAPGPILPPRGATAEEEARLLARAPLGRFGGTDEIVAAVLYLVERDFVTGTTLVVDGGRSLG